MTNEDDSGLGGGAACYYGKADNSGEGGFYESGNGDSDGSGSGYGSGSCYGYDGSGSGSGYGYGWGKNDLTGEG